MVTTSISQTKTHSSSLGLSPLGYHQGNQYQSPALRSLYNNWVLHASNSPRLPRITSQINQAEPDLHQYFGPGYLQTPIVVPQEYPQNINSMPTSGQYAQLIKRYAIDIAREVPVHGYTEDVKNSITFYLLTSTIMKYLTDLQQLVNIQVIQTEHEPINAAFEMIQHWKKSYENIIRDFKTIEFEQDTYKAHPESSIVTQTISDLISQISAIESGISGTNGILELYLLNNQAHIDDNTKTIIDKLRAILKSCSNINAKTMYMMSESKSYLQKSNKNILKTVINDPILEIGNPIQQTSTNTLTPQAYAKLINIQTELIKANPTNRQLQIDYYKSIIIENDLETSIKMLEDLKSVISKLVIKSNFPPYMAVVKLLKEATNIFEEEITNIRSCQIILKQGVVNIENSNDQSNDDKKFHRCGIILANTKQQIAKILLTLGKSGSILELSQMNNGHLDIIHHDGYNLNNAINEIRANTLFPILFLDKIIVLLNESLAIMNQ